MYVFLTVDTEFWPRNPRNPNFNALQLDIKRDIYGETPNGEFGLNYLLNTLDSEGLEGVFFIEAISALKTGLTELNSMIQLVESRGHSVELHIHTEWLDWIQPSFLPGKSAINIRYLSLEDQIILIKKGISLLEAAGLQTPVCAFRAGNYGADFNTLKALTENGIKYDSSYNIAYLNSTCNLKYPKLILQPQKHGRLLEIPINFFQDYPMHFRPTQLNAVSFAEMKLALESAEQNGWETFVIVLHSFELIKRNVHIEHGAVADHIVIDRFEKLIKYLGKNKDRFKVVSFRNFKEDNLLEKTNQTYLKGHFLNTLIRWGEAAKRRLI